MQLTSDCGKWKLFGNANPAVLIAGHSHIFALFMAMQLNPKYQEHFGVVVQSNYDEHVPVGNDYWNYVVSLAENQPTAISWNGNQHNLHFLLDANWNFSAMGYQENYKFPIVPLTQIKELYRPTFWELELILSRFSNRENLCLLGTPAPKDKKFIDKKVNQEEFFQNIANNMGLKSSKLKASSDELRVLMWKITQELTEKVAKEFGTKFMPVPSESLNSKSLLKKEYYADECTHGNWDYGALMLNKIAQFHGVKL